MIFPWFQIGATLAIGVAVVAFVQSQISHERTRVVSAINEQTQVKNAKARKARAAARAPGAVERVRQDYCRDCKL